MATNDANQPKLGRQLALQVVHTLRHRVAFDDDSFSGIVGILPDEAIILRGTAYVWTAFDAGTANTIDIGVQGGDADEFMSDGSLASAADVAFDDLANANRRSATERVVTYDMTLSGTAPTAGLADIVVEYSVNNG